MNSIHRAESLVEPQRSTGRHILMLGVDGARWDIVAEDAVGTRLLESSQQGTFHHMTMEAPTISGPGWSSILTGTTHAQHGVRDNSMVGKRLWHYPDFLAQAFFRDQATRTFAAAGWPVLVDPDGLGPIIHPRRDQQFAGLHNVIVRDGETHGYQRIDAEIADIAVASLNGSAFDVGFMYFCDVDDAGHIWGLGDENYRDAIRRVDSHIDRILTAITKRHTDLGEDWLVVITTDHGHIDEGGHGGDSERERESWVISWAPGGSLPQWPAEIAPHDLAGLMLAER